MFLSLRSFAHCAVLLRMLLPPARPPMDASLRPVESVFNRLVYGLMLNNKIFLC